MSNACMLFLNTRKIKGEANIDKFQGSVQNANIDCICF